MQDYVHLTDMKDYCMYPTDDIIISAVSNINNLLEIEIDYTISFIFDRIIIGGYYDRCNYTCI